MRQEFWDRLERRPYRLALRGVLWTGLVIGFVGQWLSGLPDGVTLSVIIVGLLLTLSAGVLMFVLWSRRSFAEAEEQLRPGAVRPAYPTREEALAAVPHLRARLVYLIVLALVVDGGLIAVLVGAAVGSDGALVGLAVILAPPAAFLTWAAWRARQVWHLGGRASPHYGGEPGGEADQRGSDDA